MKKSTIAGSALFLMVSGFALAQSTAELPEFDDVDTNADGILSKQEADAALPALGLTDSNADGVISKSDVKRVLPDVDFDDDDDSAIGSSDYEQIVQAMEELMDDNV